MLCQDHCTESTPTKKRAVKQLFKENTPEKKGWGKGLDEHGFPIVNNFVDDDFKVNNDTEDGCKAC